MGEDLVREELNKGAPKVKRGTISINTPPAPQSTLNRGSWEIAIAVKAPTSYYKNAKFAQNDY